MKRMFTYGLNSTWVFPLRKKRERCWRLLGIRKVGSQIRSEKQSLHFVGTGQPSRAAHALRLAAWSLLRSHSYLGAYLRRQRSRLGAPKAITAAAHKLGRIVYNLMRYGEAYMK